MAEPEPDRGGVGASALRHAVLLAMVCGAPLAARVGALAVRGSDLAALDLLGVVSDLGTALLIGGGIALLARRHAWAGGTAYLAWALLCYGNYEHIVANAANLSAANAGYLSSSTFLLGSAFRISTPWLLAALTVPGAAGILWLRGARLRGLVLASAGLLLVVGHSAWPYDSLGQSWRRTNVIPENIGWLAASSGLRSAGRLTRVLPADLDGTPRLALDRRGQNVLLIMIEGIAAGSIPEIAARFGIRSPLELRTLDRLARENVVFSQFVQHNRQTNRGQYALLCGDLPRLRSEIPKMSALVHEANGGGLTCLPEVLARHGYQTSYLQGAHLAFMLKDQFMPKIGFAQVRGSLGFERAYLRSKWGIDDRAFFEQAAEYIERLDEGGGPWFSTLLTLGTHHPYNVPADYRPAQPEFARAAEYVDEALGALLARLEQRGVLEDTLVLITSDESSGLGPEVDEMSRSLSQNWGYLIAMLPEKRSLYVDEPYAQLDLPLSILDYLGLRDEAEQFSGRSVFRSYDRGRELVFGNTYLRVAGGIDESGQLYVCRDDGSSCRGRTSGSGIFAPSADPFRPVSPEQTAFLRDLLAGSPPARLRSDYMQLVAQETISIKDDVVGRQLVFGGQFLEVEAGTRLDIDIEVELVGEAGSVEFQHSLASRTGTHFHREFPGMEPGDSMTLRYSYATHKPLSRIENRFAIRKDAGTNLELRFRKARLRIMPEPSFADRQSSELTIREIESTKRSSD